MNLTRFQCHKVVEAGVITGFDAPSGDISVEDAKGVTHCLPRRHDLTSRYLPVPGDYLVRYEDGYLSISPKAVFEAGYAAIEAPADADQPALDFAPPL